MLDFMYLSRSLEVRCPKTTSHGLPREAKSEYCPLRRNKSTATCCPEQSKASFL